MRKPMKKNDPVGFILKMVMILLFVAGFCIFTYPFTVDSLNNMIDQYRISQHQKTLAQTASAVDQYSNELKQQNHQLKTRTPSIGMTEEDPFSNLDTTPISHICWAVCIFLKSRSAYQYSIPPLTNYWSKVLRFYRAPLIQLVASTHTPS